MEVPLLYDSEPLSVQLMNTVWADRAGLHDALGSVESLRRWTNLAGLPGSARLTSRELEVARRLRDAVRRLAADATGDQRSTAVDPALAVEDALDEVNRHLAVQRPVIARAAGGTFEVSWRSGASGFERALADLAIEAADLVAGSSAGELRACHGPACVLYFVKDGARREWCSAGCGNRARVARHYLRHKNA